MPAIASQALKFLTIPALTKHTATVIFIHVNLFPSFPTVPFGVRPHWRKRTTSRLFVCLFQGLGDTGHGWQPVADMIRKDPGLSHVKWILPHS